ncbi:hypothetical protein BMS3Bbin06_02202 [bacterium BMS3Bbin06]|nr:hypothetical protein BMS3Bbin06_02202 [bacterium BMS3Bbin06]
MIDKFGQNLLWIHSDNKLMVVCLKPPGNRPGKIQFIITLVLEPDRECFDVVIGNLSYQSNNRA